MGPVQCKWGAQVDKSLYGILRSTISQCRCFTASSMWTQWLVWAQQHCGAFCGHPLLALKDKRTNYVAHRHTTINHSWLAWISCTHFSSLWHSIALWLLPNILLCARGVFANNLSRIVMGHWSGLDLNLWPQTRKSNALATILPHQTTFNRWIFKHQLCSLCNRHTRNSSTTIIMIMNWL